MKQKLLDAFIGLMVFATVVILYGVMEWIG